MRIKKAFLSAAVVTVVGLLAAPAMAQAPETVCEKGFWTLRLTAGPVLTTCNHPNSISGQCTTWTYTVDSPPNKVPDHIAGAADTRLLGVESAQATGNLLFYGEEAESVFGLGGGDITTTAWRLNPFENQFSFTLVMDGTDTTTGLVPVDIKKGGTKAFCAIAGPAPVASAANPLATFVEEVEEVIGGRCRVKAKTDKTTGETTVTLISGNNCEIFDPIPIEDIKISISAGPGGTDEPVLLSEALTLILGSGTCAYKQYYPTRGPVYRICW